MKPQRTTRHLDRLSAEVLAAEWRQAGFHTTITPDGRTSFFIVRGWAKTLAEVFAAEAAQALRAIPSEKRAAASRANGRKGGRPRKVKSV